MKRTLQLISLFMLLTGPVWAQERLRIMESLVMPSRILNQDVHFSVCLPENYYASNKAYPVAYLLHGLGDDQTAWLEYGRIAQYADQLVKSNQSVPIIFIMPEGFRTYYVNDYQGTFRYQDMFVNELVPHIDSLFRTLHDRQHRALMGYSMGGFGALTLYLKYPGLFGCTVPLSISIRTDQQYMTENGSEWDQQWGRLFGGRGLSGLGRITSWYRDNCPFYQLKEIPRSDYDKLRIYIDNGDKEQTLCRSNEELHILMRSLKIPHEFRVRNGGHSFDYWRSALPDALRFISDAFEGKPYRGDLNIGVEPLPVQKEQLSSVTVDQVPYPVFLPEGYYQSGRLYPVIYIAGDITADQRNTIASVVNRKVRANEISPILLVFFQQDAVPVLVATIPKLESQLRIRPGYRFRSILAWQATDLKAFSKAVNALQFTAFMLADSHPDKNEFPDFMAGIDMDALKHISFYIDAPDKGDYFEGIGNAHMYLRDKDLTHEYRVRQGSGGFNWWMDGLPAMLDFAEIRFHK